VDKYTINPVACCSKYMGLNGFSCISFLLWSC